MSRLTKKPLILIFAFIALVVASITYLEFYLFKGSKEQIQDLLYESTGKQVGYEGELNFDIFPLPKVVINKIYVKDPDGINNDNIITADQVELYISFKSLFSNKIILNETVLRNFVLNVNVFDEESSGKVFFHDDFISRSSLKKLKLINGQLNLLHHRTNNITEFKGLSANIVFDKSFSISNVDGNFKLNNHQANFAYYLSNEKLKFNINSDIFKFEYNGDSESDNNIVSKGILSGRINDIAKFMDLIYGKELFAYLINDNMPVDITGDFVVTKDNITFDNIKIDSNDIKGHANKILTTRYHFSVWDLSLNFDKINFDNILKPKDKDNFKELQKKRKFRKIIPDSNANILFSTNIKELIFRGGSHKNFSLNAQLFNKEIDIFPSSVILLDDNKLDFSGNIVENKMNSIFIGSAALNGTSLLKLMNWAGIDGNIQDDTNNVALTSDFVLTSKEVFFDNMQGLIGNSDINATLLFKENRLKSEYNLTVKATNLDLDKFDIINQLNNTKNGILFSQTDSYQSDLQWLRSLENDYDIDFVSSDISLNNKKYDDLALNFYASKGLIQITNFALNQDSLHVKASGEFNIKSIRPYLEFNINSNYLDFNIFAVKADNKKEVVQETLPIWSDQIFNIARFDRFDGKISIKAEEANINDVIVENLSLLGNFKDNYLELSELNGSIFGGEFKSQGNISCSPFGLALSFSLANFGLNNMLDKLLNIQYAGGYASMSGSIMTFGNSLLQLVSNLQSNSAIAVRMSDFIGFNVENIIEYVSAKPNYDETELSQVMFKNTSDGITRFNNIDGSFAMNGGVMNFSNIVFDTNRSKGIMAGTIDLRNKMISAAAQLAFIPAQYAQAITVDYKITNMIDAPKIDQDYSKIKQYLSGQSN